MDIVTKNELGEVQHPMDSRKSVFQPTISRKLGRKTRSQIVSLMDNDKSQLLNIFPEEIWLKVLGCVDRSSLESVNNASPFFRRLLYPERQLFLFSSVWKILGVQYEVDSDPVYSDLELPKGWDLNDARGNEQKVFPVVLKLRLVCREWCYAINKFYEDLYHNYDTDEAVLKPRVESGFDSADEIAINRKYECKDMGYWSECKLRSVVMVQKFVEHFEVTHDYQTNPFPFRKVTFYSGGGIINYLTEVIPLVKKYGRHIWFCKMDFWNSSPNCYLKFREMLTLMPNLKVLRLVRVQSDFNPIALKEVFATHPIPKLESLTYVSFNDTLGIMMENLLRNNSQVTKIEILDLNDFNFATLALPNLTHLAVRFQSMGEFEVFENNGQLWRRRLEMLHVGFAPRKITVPFNPLPRIFACLEQWKGSLTDVEVTFPYADRDEDKAAIARNFRIRLDLPHVKRLRLRMFNIMSLDLILPMKNLELLEYSCGWLNRDWETIPKKLLDVMKTREVIQFRLAHNFNIYNSNIWSLFPKLRRIHVINDGNFRGGLAFIRQKKLETSEVQ